MPYHILIIDDDDIFREEMTESLMEYNVIEAKNGIEGLNILRKPNEINLVILDVKMPLLQGTKVLKEIRRMYPKMPVIMLTAFASKDILIDSVRGNADDFIEKPADIAKLKQVIQRLLEERTEQFDQNTSDIANKIERVKHFVERNFEKNIYLKDAAKIIGLSPKYLSRIFKEATEMGFNEYRIHLRMEKAKNLLKETQLTIDQISDRIGYVNMESFIKIFKRSLNCTPTKYRVANRSS